MQRVELELHPAGEDQYVLGATGVLRTGFKRAHSFAKRHGLKAVDRPDRHPCRRGESMRVAAGKEDGIAAGNRNPARPFNLNKPLAAGNEVKSGIGVSRKADAEWRRKTELAVARPAKPHAHQQFADGIRFSGSRNFGVSIKHSGETDIDRLETPPIWRRRLYAPTMGI